MVIRPENDASRNLYKKLGYSKAFETCRVTLNPTKLGLPEDQQIVLQPHLLHAAELAAAATAVAADEGIEDGRNEDTVSLNEAAQREAHVNGNNDNNDDDDKDEGIDDDGETQNDEEQPQQNGNAEAAAEVDGDNGD